MRLVQRADQPLVVRDRDLREVVLAHQRAARARPARSPRSSTARPRAAAATRSRAVRPLFSRKPFLAHPVVVEHLAEIARPVIVEDHDDDVVLAEVIAELQQAGHRRAGGVAGEDAFLARDAPRHDRRVLVGHLLEVIDDGEVDVLRQEVLADAFGDVRDRSRSCRRRRSLCTS